jgi:hypothetical protein
MLRGLEKAVHRRSLHVDPVRQFGADDSATDVQDRVADPTIPHDDPVRGFMVNDRGVEIARRVALDGCLWRIRCLLGGKRYRGPWSMDEKREDR